MLLLTVLVSVLPQHPAVAKAGQPAQVPLIARSPSDGQSLRWSPKAAAVSLQQRGDKLIGDFELGPKGAPSVRVELHPSKDSKRIDCLAVDCDRDGRFSDAERFTCTPTERRQKWWSSFEATVQVPVGAEPGAATYAYPMALWFVVDPREPDAKLQLRWSRRGWHEGQFVFDGKPVYVLLTESRMDGVFTAGDRWQLGDDRKAMLQGEARELSGHNWLNGQAFRLTSFAANGQELRIEPFDPGFTEAEERERNDRTKADRMAKRAKEPVPFGHDFAAAMAEAVRTKKRVFVDFETTWCGPCKLMDQWIYTAADVVAAAEQTIAVKVDGDKHRDLVKKYEVKAYPTMLLLGPDGAVLHRAVGYQGVAQMVAFFTK
jgi:thiol-disulfide isomerase/thioredoxin